MAQESAECTILLPLDTGITDVLDRLIKDKLIKELEAETTVVDALRDCAPSDAAEIVLRHKKTQALRGFKVPSRTSMALQILRDYCHTIK
jgi:hypothetical protein